MKKKTWTCFECLKKNKETDKVCQTCFYGTKPKGK